MDDPVNYKNEEMDVKVDFGDLWFSSYYEKKTNSINVINDRLETWSIGVWNLTIETSYFESNGTEIVYTKDIQLTISAVEEEPKTNFIPVFPDEPPAKEEEKEPVEQ